MVDCFPQEWQDNGLPEYMVLTFENGTVKPSFLATKTLSHVLANTSFIARRPTWQDGFTTDDEYVLQFRSEEGTTVLAVWTLAGFPHVTRLPGEDHFQRLPTPKLHASPSIPTALC